MGTWAEEALRGSKPGVYWNDTIVSSPDPNALDGDHSTDLVIIGGGFSGLWAAIQAAEERPDRRIALFEAERIGFGATNRNGGFCEASLTHGALNGESRWPQENARLVELGKENLDGLEATVRSHAIECDFRRSQVMTVALEPWQLESFRDVLPTLQRISGAVELLDRDETRARLNSPTYLGSLLSSTGSALVNPAQLAWGLRKAATDLGVEVFEETPITGIARRRNGLRVTTAAGSVSAAKAIVATNAYGGPLRRLKRYVIPVYDHVLMTEPLDRQQLDSIGWSGREGVVDWGNQFHYYRTSDDNRILWGGYDATYHFNNRVAPQHDQRPRTHSRLAGQFFETFPQLEGLRFSHRWGGAIASSTRFTAAWGTTHGGNVAWVAGYTGLGVGASRFGARVALDLVDAATTERTELNMVRRKPIPFPPEPLRWLGVIMTKNAMQRADRREGREGPWLRLLSRFGVGFDS